MLLMSIWRNVLSDTLACESQQQLYEKLWFKQRIFISHILECEQSLWTKNVTKLPVNDLLNFSKEFLKNYYEDSHKGNILVVDIKYHKRATRSAQWSAILSQKNKDC